MSRARVTTRTKVDKSLMSDDMSHMFKQMMGEETPDFSIIKPKYERLLVVMSNIYTLLLKFTSLIEKRIPEYANNYKEMNDYANTLKELCKNYEIPPMPMFEVNQESAIKEYIDVVSKKYLALKNDKFVKNLVIVCKDLSAYSKFIKNTDKLSAQFIHDSPEPDMCILKKITQLPFKQLYLSEKLIKVPGAQSYILTFLHMFLKETQQVFEMLSSPDIDIDKFVIIVSNGLDKMKSHPELRGCTDAFEKIRKSTSMLKDNFGSYYGDFMASNNPNIIMENFISDVSRKVEGNIRLVSQFKRIMGFYRKQLQKNGNVPSQVTGMMNFIGDKLDKVGGSNDDDDNQDPSDSDEEVPELEDTTIPSASTSSTSSTPIPAESDADTSPVKKLVKKSGKKN